MLTRTGWTVIAVSLVLALVGGRLLGHVEAMALGLTGLFATVVSVWRGLTVSTLAIERRPIADRVSVGDEVELAYSVTNEGRRTNSPFVLRDQFDGRALEISIPRLKPGERDERTETTIAGRRGLRDLGPGQAGRVDPFGLSRRSRDLVEPISIWVHPRVHRLNRAGGDDLLPIEQVGRTPAADPSAGFHSLRDYVEGDDLRRVHWRTSARTGDLKVREYTEARRPSRLVVLDTFAPHHVPALFEAAVELSASLIVDARNRGHEVELAVTDRAVPLAASVPGDVRGELDRLALVGLSPPAGTDPLLVPIRRARPDQTVIVVTGNPPGLELGALAAARSDAILIRLTDEPGDVAGLQSMTATSAADVAQRWGQWS